MSNVIDLIARLREKDDELMDNEILSMTYRNLRETVETTIGEMLIGVALKDDDTWLAFRQEILNLYEDINNGNG